MNLEHKEIGGKYEDFDINNRVISGYLSEVDVKDDGGDTIARSAFNKTLQERKNEIFFLNQHDFKQPHGKFAELEMDSYGLKFVSNPLPNTTYSNDVLKLIEAKIITSTSIGYVATKFIGQKGYCRTITELKLYEGSTVTIPMNKGALITGLKSMTLEEISTKEKDLLKAFRNGTFTDETFVLLELALKELQTQSYELGKKEALNKPSNDTDQAAETLKEVGNILSNFKF